MPSSAHSSSFHSSPSHSSPFHFFFFFFSFPHNANTISILTITRAPNASMASRSFVRGEEFSASSTSLSAAFLSASDTFGSFSIFFSISFGSDTFAFSIFFSFGFDTFAFSIFFSFGFEPFPFGAGGGPPCSVSASSESSPSSASGLSSLSSSTAASPSSSSSSTTSRPASARSSSPSDVCSADAAPSAFFASTSIWCCPPTPRNLLRRGCQARFCCLFSSGRSLLIIWGTTGDRSLLVPATVAAPSTSTADTEAVDTDERSLLLATRGRGELLTPLDPCSCRVVAADDDDVAAAEEVLLARNELVLNAVSSPSRSPARVPAWWTPPVATSLPVTLELDVRVPPKEKWFQAAKRSFSEMKRPNATAQAMKTATTHAQLTTRCRRC
mmetsp:Transcript_12289/g.29805  ORF Transcript_12289/g.29805 Transcript_12289/m.29805 type:complete len:385 (+) Transcript_12289:445-1599(+)